MKNINQQAYEQAEKELLDKKVLEVKNFLVQTLEKIEQKKKEKSRIEEELRILRMDTEDLKNGNFNKIEERNKKSSVARNISAYKTIIPIECIGMITTGTYRTSSGTYYYF